jgi:uncharacterized membrane protein
MNPLRLNALLILALLGVGMTSYLTWVSLTSDVDPFCTGIGDCVAVQASEYADIAGIPIAAFGLAMYVGLLGLLAARRAGPWRAATLLPAWTFAIALSGVLYSAYLTYLELFVLQAICVWCVASALLVTGIFVLAVPDFLAARRARLAELERVEA